MRQRDRETESQRSHRERQGDRDRQTYTEIDTDRDRETATEQTQCLKQTFRQAERRWQKLRQPNRRKQVHKQNPARRPCYPTGNVRGQCWYLSVCVHTPLLKGGQSLHYSSKAVSLSIIPQSVGMPMHGTQITHNCHQQVSLSGSEWCAFDTSLLISVISRQDKNKISSRKRLWPLLAKFDSRHKGVN